MQTRTGQRGRRETTTRLKPFIPGRDAEHRHKGFNLMEYKDLNPYDRATFNQIDIILPIDKKRRIEILKALIIKYEQLKGGEA